MSRLRPTLEPGGDSPVVKDGTAYLLIYRSIQAESGGLLHGVLRNKRGQVCSIGRFFNAHPQHALPGGLIDEVAAVNDSMPAKTMAQRKRSVMKWLRWRMGELGLQP